MSNQLNIFSWNTDKIADAWQQLAAFDFVSCEMILNELLEQDNANEEAKALLETRRYWLVVFEELKNKEAKEAPAFLYDELQKAPFDREWGPLLLKTSLQKKLIALAENAQVFFIKESLSLADLYAQHHLYEMAENLLLHYINQHKNDACQLARLADMQYEQTKITEANHNYMLAMLINAKEISLEKLKNKKISGIIHNYGPELAAAWAWLYGENMPLSLSTQYIYSSPPEQKRVATACYLILMAEKARNENNVAERVEFRKKLHEAEPMLYQAYFNFCNSGKFLSADEL
ncbi:MAG: hypothetical protein IAF38_01880 [Bacteroidia bacterium]|nr:hypothetical protein [Bacteroidia bacterium]